MRWLVKSEPDCYAWSSQLKDGVSHWDGVRNFQARNYLRQMKVGDLSFFYHSGAERRICGVIRVVREFYPDQTDPTGRFDQVDFETVASLKTFVTLKNIKADPRLSDLLLIKQSRLSVMPIPEACWETLCLMGEFCDK